MNWVARPGGVSRKSVRAELGESIGNFGKEFRFCSEPWRKSLKVLDVE